MSNVQINNTNVFIAATLAINEKVDIAGDLLNAEVQANTVNDLVAELLTHLNFGKRPLDVSELLEIIENQFDTFLNEMLGLQEETLVEVSAES